VTFQEQVAAAIAEGQRELQAREQLERERKGAEADKRKAEQAEHAIRCDAWVRAELPEIIRRETAQGCRSYDLDDAPGRADACRRAGLKVSSRWIGEMWDEGIDHGSYYTYEVHW
jgi:hypothetical protein